MATQKTRTQNIGSAAGAALTFLGLASLAGWVGQVTCPFGYLFGIPVRIVLETLPSVFHAAWQTLQLCMLGRLLEGILQVSVSGWQLVLTLVGAA